MSEYIFGPPPPPPSARNVRSNSNRSSRGSFQRRSYVGRTKPYQVGQGLYSGQNTGPKSYLESSDEALQDKSNLLGQSINEEDIITQDVAQTSSLGTFNPNLFGLSSLAGRTNISDDDSDEEAKYEISAPNLQLASAAMAIPGTTITLESDEDIAKWIEERKKRWPTADRIRQREQEKADDEQRFQTEEQQKKLTIKDSRKSHLCRYFARNGRCDRGAKCIYAHERPAQEVRQNTKIYKRYEKPQRMPLFKRLFQNDIDKENEQVLDFILLAVQQGIIKGP
ncbi:nuclear fragile X mental retardation-interacting protein 1-domain-containing protein [Lipomyces oligophaga]|uniref:nuclear fragile X mental retardation-interacting protein 1-domain-containing protein n=1 Tax=Lipomyces oligophaga TaxID=45792 RepID=UPI0034CF8D27